MPLPSLATRLSGRRPAGAAIVTRAGGAAHHAAGMMCRPTRVRKLGVASAPAHANRRWEELMWWGIGFGGFFLYLVVLLTLGLITLRKGHWVMFIFGIVFPLLWLIGAVMPPRRS
jgi:hypothetical protein